MVIANANIPCVSIEAKMSKGKTTKLSYFTGDLSLS